MTFPRPHQRVKWESKFNFGTWFTATVINVVGDRAILRCDDGKVITVPTYRLSVIEPGWSPPRAPRVD